MPSYRSEEEREEERQFQRAWHLNKYHLVRLTWFLENGPCKKCGSWDELELDHIVPRKGRRPHQPWSWSIAKREAELALCQVLCRVCHLVKTRSECAPVSHGTEQMYWKGKCRCSVCVEAHKPREARRLVTQRLWRARTKAGKQEDFWQAKL